VDKSLPVRPLARDPERRCHLLLDGIASSARCRCGSGQARPRTNHSWDRWPEMMVQGTFVTRSLRLPTDRALSHPPLMRWAYNTSCGPL
jgi:hypothetical protein